MWESLATLVNSYLEQHSAEIALAVGTLLLGVLTSAANWLRAKTKIDTQILWSQMIKNAAATGAGAVVFDESTPNNDSEAINAVIRHIIASVPEALRMAKGKSANTDPVNDTTLINIAKSALISVEENKKLTQQEK